MTQPNLIDWQNQIHQSLDRDNDKTSHRELDPNTYHPSQIAKCKRQCAISKLGLEDMQPSDLGNMLTGTLIHEWFEDNIQPGLEDVFFELPVEHREGPEPEIRWVGHTDVYDSRNGVLYDFKTRGDYFKRNGEKDFQYLDWPDEHHRNQLLVYMRCLEVEYAQVVYVDKKNPANVQVCPEDGPMVFDWDDYNDLVRKAREIQDWLMENDLPESKDGLPFEPCGCWLCEWKQEKDNDT